MWRNTRWSVLSGRVVQRAAPAAARALFMAFAFACGALTMTSANAANAVVEAPVLAPEAASLLPGARFVGHAKLTFFGLHIYDAYYYSAVPNYSAQQPFALLLVYHRTLRGEAIASRSDDEIEKLNIGSAADRARWATAMRALFPDVRPGDTLLGVNLPGTGVQFFRNGKPLGTIRDPSFGAAFFAIWFDPRTSRPELRTQLLGG